MNREQILRWGITFLEGDSRLSSLTQDSRAYLMMQATEMYLDGKRARKLGNDELEGTIITEGRHVTFGIFSGQEFKAHIDSEYGDFNIKFIVDERTNKGAFTF